MARRPRNEWAPVYRILLKSSWYGDCVPTCVVAGPNRHRAWLYVHTTTPTVLRLHPQVVRFLHDSLTELATPTDNGISCWSLPKRTDVSYPGCVVNRYNDDAWLYVHAATPSTVRLVPSVVEFLLDALAELPAPGVSDPRRAEIRPRHR